MSLSLKKGTGKATCRLCWKKITQKDTALVVTDWHNIKQYHLKCVNKMKVEVR